jgi:translation initiation factor 2 subunit 2
MSTLFDPSVKKKKKGKRIKKRIDERNSLISQQQGNNNSSITINTSSITSNTYSYDFMLSKIYKQLEAYQSIKPKVNVRIPPINAFKVGTNKTLWANFDILCKSIKRSREHVYCFFENELGTTSSVDGKNRLLIRGKFKSHELNSVLEQYIDTYVVCKICGSKDTLLEKDQKLFFVCCQSSSCLSKRSVSKITKRYIHSTHRTKT